MTKEKIARLATAKVSFIAQDTSEQIDLAYQQSVSLNRTVEKKELLSNDESLGESVMELETKSEYTFSTEIGDISLENLALCFKGIVEEKTYSAGDTFFNGKTIKAHTEELQVGDVALKTKKIYIATEHMTAGSFDEKKCAPRTYPNKMKTILPQKKANALGRVIVDGINLATGKAQILVIPLVNLSFEGDISVSGTEFAKLSLKGKVLKAKGEELFSFMDAAE
ncbi:hypothetical protein [Campylobacter sp. RM16187]|uniref:hypothetical protein n=1 Tax=Campylobacter sp. RM16187 TaxID=1660063 RepID=UPI0021B4F6DA|nr:hypothetical protein [Campylobacter sp. RM16187]QKG29729.1 hypothetical protein CDOMF_1492 [Campylobacter sp. RM16187]